MSSQQKEATLASIEGIGIHRNSVVATDDAEYGLAHTDQGERLAVLASPASPVFTGFQGEWSEYNGRTLLLGALTAANAAALRQRLPWLRPRPLGLRTSVGLGDRLGLATPGHVRALYATGGDLAPIFAQQSIREMQRTGRTPQQVFDDAIWGVFAEGWRSGFGADADHLKTPADVDACVAAGYTFYTFDPGEYVENLPEEAAGTAVPARFAMLPWQRLADDPDSLIRRYVGQQFVIEEYTITFDEQALMRAAVKYGRAVAHVVDMYQHLVQATDGRDFEVEISVDETERPTTHAEHLYVATELRRLGVHWVSLAPRYVGRFEKGVDYIGNVQEFEADFAVHAAIARQLGPYKLSLHSGSDKFSVYAPTMRQTRGLVHLKTAGTSYLEALRTLAQVNPPLLREIYTFACDRYETDRASYHVSARLERAPLPDSVSDSEMPRLLEQFDAREILHVTFGSVLTARRNDGTWLFYDRLMAVLRAHPAAYAANLETHFRRHLEPFAQEARRRAEA
jgi:hypothetical protein